MNIAILLAAGHSKRFGSNKLFEKIGGKTIFAYSLDFLENAPQISKIFIAANKINKKKIEKIISAGSYKKIGGIITGGKTRFESVQKCMEVISLKLRPSFLVIHNAANPLAAQEELSACFRALKGETSGVAVGRPVSSTLKFAPKGRISRTIPRRDIWELETPQVVKANVMLSAAKYPLGTRDFTDDLSVLEAAGFKTKIVPASFQNRKITTPEDLKMAQMLAPQAVPLSSVGIGEDSHRFSGQWQVVSGKCLVLGGIKIPGFPALDAESDGDVILHALCNALASSLGKGSLGTYAAKMCRSGITDSREYLKRNLHALRRNRRSIKNVSFSIEAARPAIDSIAPKIKKNLSVILGISQNAIGITATSGEGLTEFGRGKGIRCRAMILTQKTVGA